MTIDAFLTILPLARQWLIDQGATREGCWPNEDCFLRHQRKVMCPITTVAAYCSNGEYLIASHRFEFASTLIDLDHEAAILIVQAADHPYPASALRESILKICDEVAP